MIPDSLAPPRATLSILGVSFEYDRRYAAGQTINEIEAIALDTARSENMQNNFRPKVKAALRGREAEALGEAELAALRADFLEYERSYNFTVAKAKASVDPVLAAAERLARDAIQAELRKRGKNPREYDSAWYEAKVAEVLERNPSLMDEARRRVSAMRSVAEAVIDI